MGVFGGRDNFSSKWITAIIVDPQNRIWLHPIKHTVSDDYFLSTINHETYAFKIVNSRIMMWYTSFTKSFRVLLYTTAHYMPISAQNNKELELVIEKNSLPKMNKLQYTILEQLSRREKSDFKPHKLSELIREINKHPERNSERLLNIKTYLEELNTEQIVTPVRNITDFIYEDIIATDPNFLATVPEAMMRAEEENRKVTNSPIGARRSYWKVIALVAIIGIVGAIAYLLYDSGAIDNFVGGFTNWTGGAFQTSGGTDWMAKYTPESLKAAIDRGEVSKSSLPPEIRGLVDSVKLPTVAPTDKSINLTP